MNLEELNRSVLHAQTFVNYYHSPDAHSSIKSGMMTMCVGTLDIALSRFNSTLLKCQQYPLIADQYRTELKECTDIINKFYNWTIRLKKWHRLLIWIPIVCLDWIGKRHIPKIKKLHDNIIITFDDSN
jgi:hypothetical protein